MPEMEQKNEMAQKNMGDNGMKGKLLYNFS